MYIKWVVGWWANLERLCCPSESLQTLYSGPEMQVLTQNSADTTLMCMTHAQRHLRVSPEWLFPGLVKQPSPTHLPIVFSDLSIIYSCRIFPLSLSPPLIYLSIYHLSYPLLFITKKSNHKQKEYNEPLCIYFPASRRNKMWLLPPFSYYSKASTWPYNWIYKYFSRYLYKLTILLKNVTAIPLLQRKFTVFS